MNKSENRRKDDLGLQPTAEVNFPNLFCGVLTAYRSRFRLPGPVAEEASKPKLVSDAAFERVTPHTRRNNYVIATSLFVDVFAESK